MTYTLDDARRDIMFVASNWDARPDLRPLDDFVTTQADTIAAKDAEIERLTNQLADLARADYDANGGTPLDALLKDADTIAALTEVARAAGALCDNYYSGLSCVTHSECRQALAHPAVQAVLTEEGEGL